MGEIHTLEDKLAELGPSPHARYRRAKLLQSSWDAFQCLGVGAMSLYFLALENEELRCPATGSGSNASLRTVPPPHCASWSAHAMVIWREGTADPLEALCAWFTNMFLISMCGNSPLAYLVAAGFASVNDRMSSSPDASRSAQMLLDASQMPEITWGAFQMLWCS